MAKPYTRVSRIHESKPDRQGDKDIRITTAAPRLPRNPSGQNRKGPGNPWK